MIDVAQPREATVWNRSPTIFDQVSGRYETPTYCSSPPPMKRFTQPPHPPCFPFLHHPLFPGRLSGAYSILLLPMSLIPRTSRNAASDRWRPCAAEIMSYTRGIAPDGDTSSTNKNSTCPYWTLIFVFLILAATSRCHFFLLLFYLFLPSITLN